MPALVVLFRLEVTLLVLSYLAIAQAHHLPNGLTLLSYVTGFFFLVLIPLLALDDASVSSTGRAR